MSKPPGDAQKMQVETAFKDANKLDLRNEIQQHYGSQPQPWFSWVFDLLKIPTSATILELGCGSGALWDENMERIPRGWDVVLSDQSTNMVYSAIENLQGARQKFHFLSIDGQALPFPNASYDAVIAVGLLDLLPDLPQTLNEIERVLKPAGIFAATAGGKGHLEELEALVKPFVPNEKAKDIGGDERRFGLENGEEWLSCCFDNIVRYDYDDQMVFPDVEPVLHYVLSEHAVVSSMTLEQLGDFVQQIKKYLTRYGVITVSVRKGLFVARKRKN